MSIMERTVRQNLIWGIQMKNISWFSTSWTSSLPCCLIQPLFPPPKAFLTYASSVQRGAQSGIHECKHQFAWERWNCPENTLQLSTHNGLRSGKKTCFRISELYAAVEWSVGEFNSIQLWCLALSQSYSTQKGWCGCLCAPSSMNSDATKHKQEARW